MDGRFADSEIFNLGSGIGDGAAVRVLAPLTRWPPSTASTPLVVSAAEILTLSRLAAIKFWAESSRLNPSCTLHRGSRVMTDWFYSLQAVYTTFMYGMTAVGHAWACCRSNICTLGQAGCTWMKLCTINTTLWTGHACAADPLQFRNQTAGHVLIGSRVGCK